MVVNGCERLRWLVRRFGSRMSEVRILSPRPHSSPRGDTVFGSRGEGAFPGFSASGSKIGATRAPPGFVVRPAARHRHRGAAQCILACLAALLFGGVWAIPAVALCCRVNL